MEQQPVLHHVALLAEPLPSHVAHERLNLGVGPRVVDEIVGLGEGQLAVPVATADSFHLRLRRAFVNEMVGQPLQNLIDVPSSLDRFRFSGPISLIISFERTFDEAPDFLGIGIIAVVGGKQTTKAIV